MKKAVSQKLCMTLSSVKSRQIKLKQKARFFSFDSFFQSYLSIIKEDKTEFFQSWFSVLKHKDIVQLH